MNRIKSKGAFCPNCSEEFLSTKKVSQKLEEIKGTD
jgi:hypothetical protein